MHLARSWLALAACCAALAGTSAWACRCDVPQQTPEALYAQTEFIFEGTVEKLNEPGKGERDPVLRLATFKVTRVWKGQVEDGAVVSTHWDDEACGVQFRKGEKYLVFARRAPPEAKARLATSSCTSTTAISHAAKLIEALGRAKRK